MISAVNLITALWLIFVIYWIVSAIGVKRNVEKKYGAFFLSRILIIVALLVFFNIPHAQSFFTSRDTNQDLIYLGVIMCLLGIGLAIWARVYLGRNWGMPMSLKENTELVTSGPYKYIRHPIYTGALFAMIGSGFVMSAWWIFFIIFTCYFIYSAFMEEKIMIKQFPEAYPEYKRRSKMLIPLIF